MKEPRFIVSIILLMFLVGVMNPGYTQSISQDEALSFSMDWVNTHFPEQAIPKNAEISIRQSQKSTDSFYICDAGKHGFVVVSKNGLQNPVLAFSYESPYPSGTDSGNRLVDRLLHQSGNFILAPGSEELDKLKTSPDYGPLLSTYWSIDSTVSEGFLVDPTRASPALMAMSQVFRYYEYPTRGVGELCYNVSGLGERCTDFSQFEFDFSTMDDKGTSLSSRELMMRMASCGKIQSYGADLNTYQVTLPVHFGYSSEMRTVYSYEAEFDEVLLSELSLGRPVPAHWYDTFFVIDGFRAPNMFHFNFGKGGLMDGFYSLDGINIFSDPLQSLLYLYLNYHPDYGLPIPKDVGVNSLGSNIMINWNMVIPDSLIGVPVKYVLMREDLIKIIETDQRPVTISKELIGGSAKIRVMAVFEGIGASELSEETKYSADNTPLVIPSLDLRVVIQNTLGNIDIYANPTVGEAQLLDRIELKIRDLRGLELLPNLKVLVVSGNGVKNLPDGDYLRRLKAFYFASTHNLDLSVFSQMNGLYQVNALRSTLPYDLYDMRHNYKMGSINLTSMNENFYQMNDLYGIDKYFPFLSKFFIPRMHDMGPILIDYMSFESYYDILPKIRANVDLYEMTFPSAFIPCYPSPQRDINLAGVKNISWQADFNDENASVYNVYVGQERNQLELVSEGQVEKTYAGDFEMNSHYYWRVEAMHNDSIYPSGIFHFSTYQSTPMPFIDGFDTYYYQADIAEESPFWQSFESQFTGTAVASPESPQAGFYCLELLPRSDAGVLIGNRGDSLYSVEFWVKNDFGEFGAELLQEDTGSDDLKVNALIGFYGASLGLVQSSAGLSSITFQADEWNKVLVDIHMNDGQAEMYLNDESVLSWSWFTRKDGSESQKPLKGIRFLNGANSGGGSSFVDGLKIIGTYSTGQNLIPISTAEILYIPMSRDLVIQGAQAAEISKIEVFDLSGRLLASYEDLSKNRVHLSEHLSSGILIVSAQFKNSSVLTKKIHLN